jgi:TRAP-type C4-dicarboxylate transport system permease large subunit
MILYVLSGVSGGQVPLGRIALGTLPFVAAFLAMVFLFFFVPGLVTIVPEMMR